MTDKQPDPGATHFADDATLRYIADQQAIISDLEAEREADTERLAYCATELSAYKAKVKELDLALDAEQHHVELLQAEITTLRASNARLVEALIHIQQVACSGSPELGIATEALSAVEQERKG